ncbi:MAG: ABC transporter substrate-binding protein [Zoogloeaceae bacterium]|jgi:NitT/TauT family transport system substrate-binding protein|nr:ABC transporter substrate-binding protein [Zoogloeaceae bacterium]
MSRRIEKQAALSETFNPGRRKLLAAAGSVALAAPLAGLGGYAWAQTKPPLAQKTKLTFAWSQVSFCLTPVPVALETGIFEKNGLDVALINYSGSNDQLLESLATGKADAAIGMIHRWLKPLESGFDVKIIASAHGGCVRLMAYKPTGITKIAQLRGKSIGVPDLAQPAKHFFSVYLKKHGIDPDKDITWKAYQADLLGLAAEKGEIDAIAYSDPTLFRIERDSKAGYVHLATNTDPPYDDKMCCVVGVGGHLIKNNCPAAAALARSLMEAYDWTNAHREEGAKIFRKYAANLSVEDLQILYKQLTMHVHPMQTKLRDQIVFFAKDFKELGVLKASTDPVKFANHVYYDVLPEVCASPRA